MRVVAIVNPVAGASRQSAAFRGMLSRLARDGVTVEECLTAAAGDGRRIAANLANAHQAGDALRAVIVVGGDGTIREVGEGLAGSALPMVIWPTGTENLMAKYFGFRADPEVIPACVSGGEAVAMDVGVANGRSFLIIAGAGFDAEVVHRLVGLRKGHITHLTYTNPLWRTFWEHRFPEFRVFSEDQLVWAGRGMVFVGNVWRYSLGLRVVRDAVHDDGLLDLCIMPCRGRLKLIAHSLRTAIRTHIEHGGILYSRHRHIRIESDARVPVQLDGDAAGYLPLDIRVQPTSLRLLVSPGQMER